MIFFILTRLGQKNWIRYFPRDHYKTKLFDISTDNQYLLQYLHIKSSVNYLFINKNNNANPFIIKNKSTIWYCKWLISYFSIYALVGMLETLSHLYDD